jgi:hypothetical protein
MEKTELIKSIANDNYLNPKQESILHALFSKRFKDHDPSYIDEWAKRIKNGSAWAHADSKTQKVLLKAGLSSYVDYRGSINDIYPKKTTRVKQHKRRLK